MKMMEEEINLVEILNILKKNLAKIVMITFVAILLIFIQEALDTTIKDEKFFSEIGLLALGGVNQMSKQEKSKTFFRPSTEDRKSFAEQQHRQGSYLERTDGNRGRAEAPTRIIHRNRSEA